MYCFGMETVFVWNRVCIGLEWRLFVWNRVCIGLEWRLFGIEYVLV